jgi:hypothetical protein
MKAAGHAKRNRITCLRREDGQVTQQKKEMEQMARGFFINLYQDDQNICPEEVLHLFHPRITNAMNEELCRDFSDEKIGNALFQMGSLKAPGLDGFLTRFFQRN